MLGSCFSEVDIMETGLLIANGKCWKTNMHSCLLNVKIAPKIASMEHFLELFWKSSTFMKLKKGDERDRKIGQYGIDLVILEGA